MILLPFAAYQQKASYRMQKLQPEVTKIKKKYSDDKNVETQKKMNAEIQQLYAKHKINPLSGCLPLIIQMPIFIALNSIMRQPYMYIRTLGDLYYRSSSSISNIIHGFLNENPASNGYEAFYRICRAKLPPLDKIPKELIVTDDVLGRHFPVTVENIAKLIKVFSKSDWTAFLSAAPERVRQSLEGLVDRKESIETFLSFNLIENPINIGEWSILSFWKNVPDLWPGILIPLMAAVTTFLSSYIVGKQSPSDDPTAQATQRSMLIMMPVIFGVMTASISSGVGLYWITSSAFQIVQTLIMGRFMRKGKKLADASGGKS
jgi:YidC/Oxa1 family membrane protein insertase